ncbi:cupin-like domain-containing protein, partial [Oculatella sp. LEGE 06141]
MLPSSPPEGGLYDVDDPDHAVPRVHRSQLTATTFFQRYQKPGIPVIITGLLDDMPIWNLSFLNQKLGELELPVRYYGRDRYQQDKRQWTSSGSGVEAHLMRFSHYAEMLRNGEAYQKDAYLARCSLSNTPLADASSLHQSEAALGLNAPATSLNLWV